MTNPFDNEDDPFVVLINHEGQYSLWPSSISVPAGWDIAHDEDTRQACVDFIEANWQDMRPLSLVRAMAASEDERRGSMARPVPPEAASPE